MQNIGKVLILLGILIAILGIVISYFGNNFKWIGNLPGDIKIDKGNIKIYFPIVTMILFSLAVNLIFKLWNYFNSH
jgi:hypothetical protein